MAVGKTWNPQKKPGVLLSEKNEGEKKEDVVTDIC